MSLTNILLVVLLLLAAVSLVLQHITIMQHIRQDEVKHAKRPLDGDTLIRDEEKTVKKTDSKKERKTDSKKKRKTDQKTDSKKITEEKKKHVIAYAVSLTGCGEDATEDATEDEKKIRIHNAMSLMSQGAAILQHSIRLSHANSPYDYKIYAFVHPDAKPCSEGVAKLGYEVLIRETPFRTSDIRADYLRETIHGASCCGAKEYIKLYAYTLLDHPVAVHLDLDSLVLQPLDDLFDAMLINDGPNDSPVKQRIPVMFDAMLPDRIDAFFTKDYNMIARSDEKYPSIQGGFIVVRPNQKIFDEYIDIVLEGNFLESRGWGGKYGWSYGGRQIQGICAYMFGEKHPNTSVELNRCVYNYMGDDPIMPKTNTCTTLQDECQDCRETPIAEIKSAHFTICAKPWQCYTNDLCHELHREWFLMRKDFEAWRSPLLHNGIKDITEGSPVSGTFHPEVFQGFCSKMGGGGYTPLII